MLIHYNRPDEGFFIQSQSGTGTRSSKFWQHFGVRRLAGPSSHCASPFLLEASRQASRCRVSGRRHLLGAPPAFSPFVPVRAEPRRWLGLLALALALFSAQACVSLPVVRCARCAFLKLELKPPRRILLPQHLSCCLSRVRGMSPRIRHAPFLEG